MTSIFLSGNDARELNERQARLLALIVRIDSGKEATCEADSGLCEYCPIGHSCGYEDAKRAIAKDLGIVTEEDVETEQDLFREAEAAFPAFLTDEPIDGADFLDWFNARRKRQ